MFWGWLLGEASLEVDGDISIIGDINKQIS